MDKKKIYFDMDGVLADFEKGVKALGTGYVEQVNQTPERDAMMWEAIKKAGHFYRDLEPIKEAVELFNHLRETYDCEILSAIPKPKWGIENSGEDKKLWVRQLLGEDVKVNIVYREQKKEFCTGKDSILIDDLQANIDAWIVEGGCGLLFNRDVLVEEYLAQINSIVK